MVDFLFDYHKRIAFNSLTRNADTRIKIYNHAYGRMLLKDDNQHKIKLEIDERGESSLHAKNHIGRCNKRY